MASTDGVPVKIKKGSKCKIVFANIHVNSDGSPVSENELEITEKYTVPMDETLMDFLKNTQNIFFYKRVKLYEVMKNKRGDYETVTKKPIIFFKPMYSNIGKKGLLYEKVKFYEKYLSEIAAGKTILERPIGYAEKSEDESDDKAFEESQCDSVDESDVEVINDCKIDTGDNVPGKYNKKAKLDQMPKKLKKSRKRVIVTAGDDKKSVYLSELDYLAWNGPNPDLRTGQAVKPDGPEPRGRSVSLARGPSGLAKGPAGLAKGSLYQKVNKKSAKIIA